MSYFPNNSSRSARTSGADTKKKTALRRLSGSLTGSLWNVLSSSNRSLAVNNNDNTKKKRPRLDASDKNNVQQEKSNTTDASASARGDGDSQESEILQLISESKSEEELQIKPLLHTIPQLLLRLSNLHYNNHSNRASSSNQVLKILDSLVDLLSMEEDEEEEDNDDYESCYNDSHHEEETVLCKNSRRHSDATAETVLRKNSVHSTGTATTLPTTSHHYDTTTVLKASDHGKVARMVGMHNAVMITLHQYPRHEGIQRTGLYLLTLLVMPTTSPRQQSMMIAGMAHLGGMEAAVQAMRQFPKSHELQATAFMFLASLFASEESDDHDDDDNTSETMEDSFQLQQSSHSYNTYHSYHRPVSEEEQERVRIIQQCRCRFVHHLKGVEWIVQSMERFPINASVQSTGIALLYGITVPIGGTNSNATAAADSCRSRMIQANVGLTIVKALHQHHHRHHHSPNDTVHRIGTKCIQYLNTEPVAAKACPTSPRQARARRIRSSGMGG